MSIESRAVQPLIRQVSHLKVVSRLLGHELNVQSSSRTITLSRDEVLEIQTTLDLFIEEATRRLSSGSMPESVRATEPVLIPARN